VPDEHARVPAKHDGRKGELVVLDESLRFEAGGDLVREIGFGDVGGLDYNRQRLRPRFVAYMVDAPYDAFEFRVSSAAVKAELNTLVDRLRSERGDRIRAELDERYPKPPPRPLPEGAKRIEVFADHHLVWFGDAGDDDGVPGDEMALAFDGGFVLTTASGWTVELDVEVRDARPEVDLAECDHAVEVGFESRSERLEIGSIGGPDDHVEVPTGPLTALVVGAGFREAHEADDGRDFYRVLLWPERSEGVRVLKQYDGP